MRTYTACLGMTLIALVEAEYKYYCEFQFELLHMCIGRKKGGQLTTLSMHGASINPERPNYTRFVDDVCTVTDVPEDSTGSEGYIRVNTEMCSIGESQEARMDYQRIFNSVEGTSFYVRLRRSSRFYHLDKLKPIAMQKLNLPHCQRDGMFVGTFESHSPDPWRVDVQEFNCRASRRGLSKLTGRDRPVRQLKAIFKIKREDGEWETVPILGTVNNIMKLDTTRGHGADASTWTQAEAFFFEFYSRNEFFDAVMITSGGKPVMLFDTRIKPQQQLQHLYYPSERLIRRDGRPSSADAATPPPYHTASAPPHSSTNEEQPPSYDELYPPPPPTYEESLNTP